nr:secoisolariciresinol dehydrogenase-like [Tanacetum cinerariifolium]
MNAVYPHRLLEGKVAIITGGASGFGESTVRLFAKHGAKVVIADVQDKLGLSLCNDLATKIGGSVIYLHCDVTKESDIENTVNTAVYKFGKLDIMFNNAGIPGNLDFTILNSDNENFKRVVPMADDVAEAAVYLGSDASKFVTGVNLVVDGGYSTTNPTYSRVIKQTFEDLAKKKECCNGNG